MRKLLYAVVEILFCYSICLVLSWVCWTFNYIARSVRNHYSMMLFIWLVFSWCAHIFFSRIFDCVAAMMDSTLSPTHQETSIRFDIAYIYIVWLVQSYTRLVENNKLQCNYMNQPLDICSIYHWTLSVSTIPAVYVTRFHIN